MNLDTSGLPPEMQQRIAQIVEGAKANAVQPVAAPDQRPLAPQVRPPSLMDHTVALRQEVAELKQQLAAVAQVTEAVGNAVGQLYNAFFQQPEAPTYSSAFEAQGQGQVTEDDY